MEMSYAARYLLGEYSSLAFLAGIEILVLFLVHFIREQERVIGIMALLGIVAKYVSFFLVLFLAGIFIGDFGGGKSVPVVFAKVADCASRIGLVFPVREFVLSPGMNEMSVNAVVMGWAKFYLALYMVVGLLVEWPIIVLSKPRGKRLETWKAMLMARLASYAYLFFTISSRDIGMSL